MFCFEIRKIQRAQHGELFSGECISSKSRLADFLRRERGNLFSGSSRPDYSGMRACSAGLWGEIICMANYSGREKGNLSVSLAVQVILDECHSRRSSMMNYLGGNPSSMRLADKIILVIMHFWWSSVANDSRVKTCV